VSAANIRTRSVSAGTRIRTVIHSEVGPHIVLEWIVTSAVFYLKCGSKVSQIYLKCGSKVSQIKSPQGFKYLLRNLVCVFRVVDHFETILLTDFSYCVNCVVLSVEAGWRSNCIAADSILNEKRI
jgi:hypothetical protein